MLLTVFSLKPPLADVRKLKKKESIPFLILCKVKELTNTVALIKGRDKNLPSPSPAAPYGHHRCRTPQDPCGLGKTAKPQRFFFVTLVVGFTATLLDKQKIPQPQPLLDTCA